MRILVTGAAGMLGTDLVALLEPRHEVTAVDLDVDVTDAGAVAACFRDVGPEAVVHCAAWTDVDGAEDHADQAEILNVEATGNVARAAAAASAALVYPSTDYVFDGSAGRPYREDDAVAPASVYGRTKLAGERAAMEAHPTGTRVARTAWLYGAAGKNFVDTMRRLGAERDEVSVVDDQEGSPTWTKDLARAIEELIVAPPGVYHTAGGGSVTWAGLAEAVFELVGASCRVGRITTEELARPAPRPANSALLSSRPAGPRLRHWREALADYIKETE